MNDDSTRYGRSGTTVASAIAVLLVALLILPTGAARLSPDSSSASPAAGAAVARGDPTACRLAAVCLSPSPASVPRAGGVAPSWFNATAGMGAGPTNPRGSLAFDPLLHGGEFVYFGGQRSDGSLSASTWAYAGGQWANVSAKVNGSPAARYGAAMDFDPAYDGVVLYGGISANGSLLNDGWLLTSDRWHNLSAVDPLGGTGPAVAFESFAWDPALQAMLLVGGCTVANCSTASNAEWTLNRTGWHLVGAGPAGSTVYGAGMAFDLADATMLRFGGEYPGSAAVSNATFALNGSTWSNLTISSRNCALTCQYPPGGVGTALSWFGAEGELVLFGGWDPAGSAGSDTTWSFLHGQWSPVASSAAPPAAEYAEMAENSTSTDPLLLTPECLRGCVQASWSLGTSPAPAFTVFSPNPADALVSVSLEFANYPGNGSGPESSWMLEYGDGTNATGSLAGLNASSTWSILEQHAWAQSGTFPVRATVEDFFHRPGTTSVQAMIAPSLELTARADPTRVGISVPVAFTATVAGGSPPVRVAWSFDDGTTGQGGVVNHSFGSVGVYQVSARATDAGAGGASSVINISVVRTLAVSIAANWSTVDAGVPVGFLGSASGGSGKFVTYNWSFGDGTGSSSATPSHPFGTAGTYSVMLNVTDSVGTTGLGSYRLLVDPPLAVAAFGTPSSIRVGTTLAFAANASGGTLPLVFDWSFGDGASATTANTSHQFATAGATTISLWVNDSGGGSVLRTLTINVTQPSGPSAFPVLYLVLPLALFGAGAAVLVSVRRRRRRATSEVEEKPAEPAAESPVPD
ncbi:MAG: PKD domain-containing protein [Thermoplasmata archaeon]|nr:PKD domain-containing protein [Thermoplasmata archaeon]